MKRRRHHAVRTLERSTFKPGDPPPEGYRQWHEWAGVQRAAGIQQVQCGACKLWRTPQEMMGSYCAECAKPGLTDAAKARGHAIMAAEGPRINALINAAVSLAAGTATISTSHTRAEALVEVAEGLSRAVTPHTPCANGCSHCCHMATNVSGYEARMIGRYVGREPRALGRDGAAGDGLAEELRGRYTGVACTFLVDGRCSVYPVRPIACRLHHSLNDTPDNCRIIPPGSVGLTVPLLNFGPVQAAVAAMFMSDDFGDIREFFPPQESTP